jgi:hypothetical protein
MELIKGRTLKEIVKAQGPMSAGEAMLIGMDLCHALAAVHRAGLLHQDVKANNVMRAEGGRVVLMDFGAGRAIPKDGERIHDLVGTPAYLAPELFHGRRSSVASDLYSLGVLLYHLVTGEYPIAGTTAEDVGVAHEREERRRLQDLRPDMPTVFVQVIERALSPTPADRFRSAGEFGAALAAAAGIPFTLDRDRYLPTWTWVAAALAVGAMLGGAFWFAGREPAPALERSPASSQPAAAQSGAARAGVDADAYRVAAQFYALRQGRSVELSPGSGVMPGDKLFLTLDVSRGVFVYVVNQDETGDSYLLFPLPGQELTNPVRPGVTRLPGTSGREELYWQVTTAGGREHFYIFVTPERLDAFEQVLTGLPQPEFGRPVTSARLSNAAVGALRSVGGLVKGGEAASSLNASQLPEAGPLQKGAEAARGLWSRQVTFANPRR